MKNKSIETLAYTAGIVDGEGHISLLKRHETNTVRLQVAVTNTNEWLCQWLKMQFGGRVQTMKPFKVNWKVAYRWQIDYKHASYFLKLILPYLNLKRGHAELAIKFQARRQPRNRFNNEESNILDEADRLLMANFNKRGVDRLN